MFRRRTFFLAITLPALLVGSTLLVLPLLQCTTTGTGGDMDGSQYYYILPSATDIQILAHSGQSEGMRLQDLPVWLATYIRSGNQGIEALSDYGENYAFVIEDRVTALQEIRQWISTDNPMRALSFQVLQRLRVRLTEVTKEAAPRKEIPLMEAAAEFLSAAGEAFYGGVREINRWWIQTTNSEYRGYIFLVIDQEMLDRRIDRLMVDNDFTLTQEEREIWNRTRF